MIKNKYTRQYLRRWCERAGVAMTREVWIVKRAIKRENLKAMFHAPRA